MKKQFLLALVAVCIATAYFALQSGATNTAARPAVSYENDVQPIFEMRCDNCHMGEYPSEGLGLDSYETLMAGSQNGPVIIPGNAEDSLLIEKVVEGEMPKRGPKLTPAQIQTLIDWINAGALNN
jgi:hypothetical protein